MMKSINIIYKRPRKNKPENQQSQKNQFRRYVDEYFTKIKTRNIDRQQNQQKMRTQTARITSKFNHVNKAFDSLNIMTLKTPVQEFSPQKNQSQRIFKKTIKFNVQKIRRNESDFALKVNQQHQNKLQRGGSTLYQFMRPKDLLKHSKVSLVGKLKCIKDVTIIISADFIINQFSFWSQQSIDSGCLKGWKTLIPLVNVVWLVRKLSTAQKIQQFAQNWNLKIDGILLLESNKRQPLTVSFYNFQQEAKLKNNHKLVIINSLRNQKESQKQQLIPYYEFKNSLPVVNHPVLVHFIRTDISNDKNRFNNVLKVVSCKHLPPKFYIQPVLIEYRQNKIKLISSAQIKMGNISEITLKNLQNLKAKLYTEFEQSIGLNAKIQGDSLFYIIGDIIKRNYSIAKQFYKYCNQIQSKKQRKSLRNSSPSFNQIRQSKMSNSKTKTNYNQDIHIWNF